VSSINAHVALTPALSKGEGVKSSILDELHVKVLFFGGDLGEANLSL